MGWSKGRCVAVVLDEVFWGGATISIDIQGGDKARAITKIWFYLSV